MRFKPSLAAGLALASVSAVSADDTLSVSVSLNNVLHVPPPLASGSVSMYPSRHPNHDGTDVEYLVPRLSRRMYFAQEGHRKAIHGSKHAQLKATFKYPTVVLDQSDYVTGIKCSNRSIEVCFQNPKARDVAEKSWVENTHSGIFHLITYHRGCGDLTGHRRSYFLASQPVRNVGVNCVVVPVESIEEHDALESGEVSWGMYEDPEERRRGVSAVKGHIRAVAAGEDAGAGPDDTIDLESDLAALEEFFNTTEIDPNRPAPEDPIDFIFDDGTVEKRDVSIARRDSLPSTIIQGYNAFIKAGDKIVGGAVKVAAQIVVYAVEGVTLIYEAFTTGIDRSYHHDYHVNEFVNAGVSNKGFLVLGEKGYLVYDDKKAKDSGGSGGEKGDPGKGKGGSKLETGIKIACVKCGLEADFTIDGRFAFHVSTGITAGRLVVDMAKDAKAYAHIGITVNGKYPVIKYKEQIAAVPLSPITIPGLFTVGPEVSFSASFNFDLSGEIELIVGGDVTLSKGKVILDLKNKADSKIESGLVPTFEPIAKAKGKLEATAALGLPIGLEVGVDILNGKFKATVGLVDTPSAYISAGFSVGAGSPCDDGIELRLGAKNKLEVSALDVWSLPISELIIYEKGLGCVSLNGFDKDRVQPDKSDIFNVAKEKLGGTLTTDGDTKLRDVASRIDSAKQQKYWSIIMDKEESSTLLSGQDGYIYLAKSEEKNELTEAWGTTDPASPFYAFDSLGRILSYDKVTYQNTKFFMAEIIVSKARKVPKKNLPALISRLHLKDKSPDQPLAVLLGGWLHMRYPTFCKVSGKGLRLYATKYIVDKDGKLLDAQNNEVTEGDDVFTQLGLKKTDCRTVNLLSSGFKAS